MSFQLETHEELTAGVRRIALEELDAALGQLTNPGDEPGDSVHSTRKHFKKLRGLIRLVRDEIGKEVYRRENKVFRDASRHLSAARDAAVMVDTLDDLVDRFGDELRVGLVVQLRRRLVEAQRASTDTLFSQNGPIPGIAAEIRDARERVGAWPLKRDGFGAVRGGIQRVYRRGRKAYRRAYREPSAEHFHEWRKRTKYLWYQMRILHPIWPATLGNLAAELHALSDDLGDEHDLAVLRGIVAEHQELFANANEFDALTQRIDERRSELRTAARVRGARLFAETPKGFARRVREYWKAPRPAREQVQPDGSGPEQPVEPLPVQRVPAERVERIGAEEQLPTPPELERAIAEAASPAEPSAKSRRWRRRGAIGAGVTAGVGALALLLGSKQKR